MGKEKKEKRRSEPGEEGEKECNWEELVSRVGPIASPLAPRKLTKKLYKIIKKANKEKQIRKGVKEVQKFIRKGEKGIVIFAGDTSPIEVICHMPVVCEEANLPYCYTPSKEDLGAACGSKRPTCMVLVKTNTDYKDLFDELSNDVKDLPQPLGC